ncbi:MAG: hypothetical protein ACPG31_01305 [Planctomycetota bacterium]
MATAKPPEKHSRLLRAGGCSLLGLAFTGIGFWVFIEGVATANKPHEVSGGWALACLAVVVAVLAVVASVLLVRNFRHDGL